MDSVIPSSTALDASSVDRTILRQEVEGALALAGGAAETLEAEEEELRGTLFALVSAIQRHDRAAVAYNASIRNLRRVVTNVNRVRAAAGDDFDPDEIDAMLDLPVITPLSQLSIPEPPSSEIIDPEQIDIEELVGP